jgi:hypothetical protein
LNENEILSHSKQEDDDNNEDIPTCVVSNGSLIQRNINLDEELKMLEEWLSHPRIGEDCMVIADRKHEEEGMHKASNKILEAIFYEYVNQL